jgi:hypothetical protein
MGDFCIISFEVSVFHRIVSSLTISISITWKLTLLLLCLLSTTTTSIATKKLTMATSACNQVMNNGSDLQGVRILFQDHLIPEFIPLSKVIQVNYNGVIDDMTLIDTLFFDTSTKDKLKLTTLDDLKAITADLVVIKSSNDPTTKAGTDRRAKFLELYFQWKDSISSYHGILSTKDLAKAIQASIADPHSSHSFYEKELGVIYPYQWSILLTRINS